MGLGVPLFLLLPQEEARHSHPTHPQPPLSLKALPLAPRVPATPCPDGRSSQRPRPRLPRLYPVPVALLLVLALDVAIPSPP